MTLTAPAATMLESIEQEILDQAGQGESLWVAIAKKLIDVRNDGLFVEAIDPASNKPVKTFEAYLRRVSKLLRPRLSSGSVTTLKSWVYKFEIFDEQMAYGEDWLMDMGSHANVLLRAANINPKGRRLEADDRPLSNGGMKLGYHSFKVLCDRIHENVTTSTGPEDDWGIADTQAEVAKLLGTEAPVVKEWKVRVDENNLVQVENLRYIVGDQEYDYGPGKTLIALDDFLKIAKGPHHRISGLPQ